MKSRTSQTRPRVSISIRVDQSLADAVKRLADEEDRSVSYFAKRALRESVEAREEATS